MALRAKRIKGFSASVIGPPNTRNSCHTNMRKRIAHAVYCMALKALVTKGKYSSIAVISVPSAFKNSPDTASISFVAALLIQVTIPSKIQSSKMHHLRSCLTCASQPVYCPPAISGCR